MTKLEKAADDFQKARQNVATFREVVDAAETESAAVMKRIGAAKVQLNAAMDVLKTARTALRIAAGENE